jgi:hypothetical protein
MAKKTVATLGKGGAKDLTKVIKAVKSPKTGAYMFEEKILPASAVKDFIAK